MRATVTLLILLTLFSQTAFARDDTQLNLPDGAKVRLGKGWINEIVYSPNGSRLAVAGSIGIWIYDAHTGEELALLTGYTGSVISVAFSPDGRTLASGSSDDTIRLWDTSTSEHRQTLTGHTDAVNSLAFSSDGRTLASGSTDKTIRLWDAVTGTHKDTLTGHRETVNSVAFSPDGGTLASGSYDGTIRLWDVGTGTPWQIRMEHTESVSSVAFSPDGRTLASGSSDDTIRLWDLGFSVPRQILTGHEYGVSSVAFSPDGRTLASGGYGDIRLWDVGSGTPKASLTGHKWGVQSVAFSPDGSTLASGGWENKVNLWDAVTGGHRQMLTEYTKDVRSVAFSPDGRTLASGNGDATLRLWDAVTGAPLHILTGHTSGISSVAFSPDGRTIASGSRDETIRFWDADTGRHRQTTLTGHAWGISSVVFSPDGRTLASGGWWDNSVRLWDAVTGEPKSTLTGHKDGVRSIAFSPDGRTLASGGGYPGGTIYLWDVATGEHRRTLAGHTYEISSLAFSPDGGTLASGSYDGTVLLWELTPSANANAIVSLAPSPVQSPVIGASLRLSLNIADGANVAGFQATVGFDPTALRYISGTNGGYLPTGAFFMPPVVEENRVTLAVTTLAEAQHGDGALATLTFEVIAVKTSTLSLFEVHLVSPDGERWFPRAESGQVIAPPEIFGDVNKDGVVNIQDLVVVGSNFRKTGENRADVNGDGVVDIVDLVVVAGAIRNAATAPAAHLHALGSYGTGVRVGGPNPYAPTAADVQGWLTQARGLDLTDATLQRGIIFLEHLLAVLTPKETALLPNYPNPFNPETWIPYHLAKDADVQITIYDRKGVVVRRFELGYQPADIYQDRSRAAYWNGRNTNGELVASGVYFYQLRAGDYSALRRMVVVK